MTGDSPPKFAAVFAAAVHRSAEKRGWIAFVPWLFLSSLIFSYFTCLLVNKININSAQKSDYVTIISAMMVVSAFLGSTSVGLTAHLQKIISEYPFSKYLKDHDLFDEFLFWPQFTLAIQIFNILLSTMGCIMIVLFENVISPQHIIIFLFYNLIYTFIKTWGLIELIRNATWHYESYMSLYAEET